jgi:hypothetical protein
MMSERKYTVIINDTCLAFDIFMLELPKKILIVHGKFVGMMVIIHRSLNIDNVPTNKK